MLTLCIRYTLDPSRVDAFQRYVENEQSVDTRFGRPDRRLLLADGFRGPTNIAYGLIEFEALSEYERYRQILADDPAHRGNVADLVAGGAVLNMERSFIRRHSGAPFS